MADTASQPRISLALGGARKARLPANGVKRPHSALDNKDDEDGDESLVRGGSSSTVSHFDAKAGGAIDQNRPKSSAPLVIAPQKNRDWKAASKRRRQHGQLDERTHDAAQQIAAIEEAERLEKSRSFGLNVTAQDKQSTNTATNEEMISADAQTVTAAHSRSKTADESAMDALLGNKERSTLVVPAVTETDAFLDDFRSAPEVSTLDDYARVPVEEFGAAMLRGMGWKDGEGVGSNKGTKVVKTEVLLRRPALLGIGAKSDAAVDAELGGWGRAAKGKEIKIYNPVLLKDKKTGELFTEEELQKRREEAQRMAFEEEFEQRERNRERRKRRDRSRERRDHADKDRRRRSHERTSYERDDDNRRREDRASRKGHEDDRDARRHTYEKDSHDQSHRSDRDDGRSRGERSDRDRHKSERRHRHEHHKRDRDRDRDRSRDRGRDRY